MANSIDFIGQLKNAARSCFALCGFQISRVDRRYREPPVMGTFPPHTEYSSIGDPENYFIHAGYRHRSEAIYYDDRANTDEWQREVYRFAREVFDKNCLKTVCDLGCGSAFKLLRYFRDCDP